MFVASVRFKFVQIVIDLECLSLQGCRVAMITKFFFEFLVLISSLVLVLFSYSLISS